MQRSYFITGTGRGLGQALATLLAARGDRVYAGYHSDPPAVTPGIVPIPLDVTKADQVAAAARRVLAEAGRIDCLINNGAILGPMDQGCGQPLDYDAIRQVIEVNAIGALRVTEAFWPVLAPGAGRLVVNISSEAGSIGQCGRDGWFGYGMSKAAFNMMSAQFHNAVRPHGGRVMVLHPGWVRSYMQGHLDTNATLSPEESAAALIKLIDTRGSEMHPQPLFLDWKGDALPW